MGAKQALASKPIAPLPRKIPKRTTPLPTVTQTTPTKRSSTAPKDINEPKLKKQVPDKSANDAKIMLKIGKCSEPGGDRLINLKANENYNSCADYSFSGFHICVF